MSNNTPPPGRVAATVPMPEHLRALNEGVKAKMKQFGLRFRAVLEAPDEATKKAAAKEARIAFDSARRDLEELFRGVADALPPDFRHVVPGLEQQRLILDQAAEFLDLAESGRMIDCTPRGVPN